MISNTFLNLLMSRTRNGGWSAKVVFTVLLAPHLLQATAQDAKFFASKFLTEDLKAWN